MAAARDQLAAHAARLEKECGLYERDLERAMESCDELARESDDLRKRLRDAPDVTTLNNEVEALQRDKEILRTNLNKAEEETLPPQKQPCVSTSLPVGGTRGPSASRPSPTMSTSNRPPLSMRRLSNFMKGKGSG